MQTIEVVVKKGQSLFDIAVQEHGDIEAVFSLVQENDFDGITDNIFEGDELLVSNSARKKQKVNYIKNYAPIATISSTDRPTGIGFWIIGKDFVVS